ncbi:MAG: Crp/Fnr family transcriptional regulator [Bacteroidia bacterium]|nr:Crp/Fnr family transcriptional regulator [Bacteroidia bacterium]
MNTGAYIIDTYINYKNSVFKSLGDAEKKLLSDKHESYTYKKGEIIFKEGDKPTGLISLLEGKVKIFKEGVGGREQIIRMAKPYGFIGYRALFAEENYAASAVAIEDSIIYVIEKNALFKILRENSNITLLIMKRMASELGSSNNRTVSLTQKHIRGRLAETLLFLKETYNLEEDNATIKIYLSREDVASLSNMTTSNAIRTLSAFAGEKVIAIEGRKIKILDLKKLERISELG